jgi:hypothetical protein
VAVWDATVAGLVAGAVMSLEKMIEAAARGRGFWRPPNLIASIVLGVRADTGRFIVSGFLTGMILHAAASAFMGWFYGWGLADHVGGWNASGETLLILGYAMVNWAVYQYLLMPWLAPVMNRESSPVFLAVAHLVWGLAFAWWYLLVAGS